MKLRMDVKGDERVEDQLKKLGLRARSPQPVLTQVGRLFRQGFQRNFAAKGGYFGDPWPALSPATSARKGSSQPLVATGALRASLGAKTRVTKTQVRTGSADFKVRFMQGGTERGVPARPAIGIAPQDKRRAVALLEAYLLRGL